MGIFLSIELYVLFTVFNHFICIFVAIYPSNPNPFFASISHSKNVLLIKEKGVKL